MSIQILFFEQYQLSNASPFNPPIRESTFGEAQIDDSAMHHISQSLFNGVCLRSSELSNVSNMSKFNRTDLAGSALTNIQPTHFTGGVLETGKPGLFETID